MPAARFLDGMMIVADKDVVGETSFG